MNYPMNFIRNSNEYCTPDKFVPAPYFRRNFQLKDLKIKKATLLICGLGFYEVYINGIDITKGHLAPYRSNLDHYIYYDSYELSDKLVDGKNVIGVLLGNGFQNPLVETWRFSETVWRGAPILSFSLEIEYIDETVQTVISDTDTKTACSPILLNDIHLGEYYDARLEIENWNSIGFDDSKWKNAEIASKPHGQPRLCMVEPIVERGELKPVSITKYENGYIYDFGVNDSGICKLSIIGKMGQKILLQHFEKLVNGKPFLNNIKFKPEQRFQEDEYICSGNGLEVHTPRFTYHGFRYVYVTGINKEQATSKLLTFILMSSNIRQTGCFECSDEMVNKIQDATIRSDISNFYYFPTDCPQREKNGWTADASLSAEQMLINFAPEKSLKEWLVNIYRAIDEQGRVPGIIPNSGWGYDKLNGPAWDNVIVNLPYYIYIYRGDKSVLEDLKNPLMRYLTYLYNLINEDELIEYGLGDWCQTDTITEDAFDTPSIVTNSIMAVDIAEKASYIYSVLEMTEQMEYAQKLGLRIRNALRTKLFNTNNAIALCKTQTAQAMAIYYKIFDTAEIPKAVEKLVELIKNNNGFMKVGVLGGRVIFRVLAENGYSDLAYDMITRPEFPSYANWIKRGATTLWELFTLDDEAKGSLNHHFWGDVSAWFYTYLAGIKLNPEKDSPEKVIISPCFISKLDYVKAECELQCGKLSVKWERKENEIKMKVFAPQDAKITLILNDGYRLIDGCSEKEIVSGEYIIVK